MTPTREPRNFADLTGPQRTKVLVKLVTLVFKHHRDEVRDFAPVLRESVAIQRLACYVASIPCPDVGMEYLKPEKATHGPG